METVTIDKEVFDKVNPYLKPYIKDNCNYCGDKITRESFGLISKDITCCNSILCLTEAVAKEELNSENKLKTK